MISWPRPTRSSLGEHGARSATVEQAYAGGLSQNGVTWRVRRTCFGEDCRQRRTKQEDRRKSLGASSDDLLHEGGRPLKIMASHRHDTV
jgi:hypothetical protein